MRIRLFSARQPLRPPGAVSEREFNASCIRCGKCAQACPYRSIVVLDMADGLDMSGTPAIDARKNPCYLCLMCPPVCPSGALDRKLAERKRVRMGLAKINTKECLAYQGTMCRSCYQSCPLADEAIRMDEELRPVIDKQKCVGCGICENVCPVDPQAIVIEPGKNT